MSKSKNNIVDQLYKCEEIKESINNLLECFERFKSGKGGVAKFVIYPDKGDICETILSEKAIHDIVNVLITEYNDILRSTQKQINESFHAAIKDPI